MTMTGEGREVEVVPEVRVPQLVALDFDRTLGDVSASMERLYLAAKECGIEADSIIAAQKATEADGGSFDPLPFVQKQLTPQLIETFYAYFLSDGPSILYPDAKRLLEKLAKSGVPHHVLTYGVNVKWQELKLYASGYRGSYLIMPTSDKGSEIEGWQNQGGQFRLYDQKKETMYLAPSVCLIDDKAVSFHALPDTCTGYLLQRPGGKLSSQQGEVSSSIQVISSLDELDIVQGKLQNT